MTRLAGDSLPPGILSRLQGSDLESCAEDVILAFCVDEEGWPHAAMLSPLEVIAPDARRIRAALFSTSSLLRHVQRNPHVTLVLVSAGMACYIKGDARLLAPEMPGTAGVTPIEIRVRQVLLDEADAAREGAGALVSGITYRRADVAADLARARPLLAALAKL